MSDKQEQNPLTFKLPPFEYDKLTDLFSGVDNKGAVAAGLGTALVNECRLMMFCGT